MTSENRTDPLDVEPRGVTADKIARGAMAVWRELDLPWERCAFLSRVVLESALEDRSA